MNEATTAQRFSSLNQTIRVLRLLAVAQTITIAVLVIGFVFKTQIVTIVPSNVMSKATYTSSTADEGALSSWGLYIATLLGNVTPSNADFVADSMGHLLSPSIYKTVMGGVSDQVAKIKTDQLTLQFDPAKVKFDSAKNVVFVDGWLTTTDAHGSAHREERTYEIYFSVVNYQPRVVGLDSYAGKPHFGK